MIDKNLLENRKDDWLAQEYGRENLRNNLDLDDAKKLKDEHYREHDGKNEDDFDFFKIAISLALVFLILFLFGVLFYEMFVYLDYCLKGYFI